MRVRRPGRAAHQYSSKWTLPRNLRAALPLIKGNTAMLGPALFYLGVANYNLARLTLSKAKMLEAAKFSEDSAKIAGPYQDQAYKNASLMKTEAASMR